MHPVEQFIKELVAARDIVSLYSEKHPEFLSAIEKAHETIGTLLSERGDLSIAIVGTEFACGKDIFFQLSERLQPVIKVIKERGIECLSFSQGLTKDELIALVTFITIRTNETATGQEFFSAKGVRHIVAGKLTIGGGSFSEDTEGSASDETGGYENSLDVVSDSIETMLDEGAFDPRNLKYALSMSMTNLMDRYQDFIKLSSVKRYDVVTFTHMLNVSILSMFFATSLGFEKKDVHDIGTAALFHDMGKLYVSRKLISKAGQLSDTEFGLMRNHAVLGAEIMLNYVDSLGELPVIVAYEHHIKFNGRGYPKVPSYYKPHIASGIVSFCDVYDALTQRRSYKRDYPPNVVYNIMNKGRGEDFSPELFDRFFQVMGLWPVGTIVVLNDGRTAIVREEHHDDIERPIVQIVTGGDGEERIDLKEHKEHLSVERSLNPLAEGKEYVSFI